MKIPWPREFEDGDVLSFLKEFEAVAELVGVKEPKAKLVVLGTLLRGRAKAVYDSLDGAGGKTTWETVTERLAAEFDSPVGREDALQKFRLARLPVDGDPLVLAVELTRLLRRALPSLDEESEAQLLASQFIESVPATVSQQLKLVNAAQPMDISELAKVTRQLMTRTVAPVGCEKQEMSNVEKKIEELEREIAAIRVNNKRNDKCYACGGTGHWKINCPTRRRRRYVRRYNECSFYPRNLGIVALVDRGAVYTRVNINERDLVCLIDTGAAVSLIGKEQCKRIKPCTLAVHTIGGHMLEVFGVSNSIVKLGDAEINFPFVVTTSLSRPILGADFLREVKAIVDLRSGKVVTKYGSLTIHESSEVAEIRVAADVSSKKPNIHELCKKYAKLFTGDGEPYGFCDRVKHEIPIKNSRVNIFATRRVPVHLEAEVNRQVQEMLKEGIIEEADSPYSSPVLLVKKPNGKYRFCVDFRELNNITDLKPCATPTVVETLDRLQNATVFTVLDLRSGYWQLPIKQSDRSKTAFTVRDKQYQFKRMPFGLAGAPFTFRRLMTLLLKNLDNVEVYGDDVVVYSQTEADHIKHVEAVLKRIDEFGLRINKDKSQIAKSSVTLLGHKVGNGEIKPLPEKILTIKNIAVPNSKRKLRQFLGRAAFYSRFVKNFNEIAAPLYKLLSSTKFTWTETAEQTFNRIKNMLDDRQMTLRLPEPGRLFTVATDASDHGIGAVLSQADRVVEYASRVLTPAEQKYSTIEKECLAIVWAVEKWRPYLLGRRLHIETDHKPLQWLKTARDPRGKLARWMIRLQEYDFSIGHVPGKENVMADYLSRPDMEADLPLTAYAVNSLEGDPLELVRQQKADPNLREVIRVIKEGADVDKRKMDKEVITLLRQKKRLRVNSYGVLTWQDDDENWVAVIPKDWRRKVIHECHQVAHTGIARTTDLLRQSAYWPSMRDDVAEYVLTCQQCQLMKSDRYRQPPLQSIPVTAVGDLWSVDVMGPFPQTASGNQYLLVMTEHATRWVDAVPIADQRARTVTEVVIRHIVACHGIPKMILTDQGPCFESDEFKARLKQFGIKRIRTTPYHPQTNGLTERNNRTLKEWLASKGGNWEKELPLILLAHRSSTQGTTKKSPFLLMYGRQPRLPMHNKTWPQQQKWTTTRLRKERKEAIRNVEKKQISDTKKAEQQRRTWKPFAVGDLVKCRERKSNIAGGAGSGKLAPKWEGPYVITERRGSVYTIRREDKQKRVNASQLQRWFQDHHGCESRKAPKNTAVRRSERLRQQLVKRGDECGACYLY
ncbi:unnamed protein product [Schistosoma haematobium]|nr:unnamed protein product [Schistosoma haematobium]